MHIRSIHGTMSLRLLTLALLAPILKPTAPRPMPALTHPLTLTHSHDSPHISSVQFVAGCEKVFYRVVKPIKTSHNQIKPITQNLQKGPAAPLPRPATIKIATTSSADTF